MGSLEEKLARLRNFNAWVRRSDSALAEESADLTPPAALESMESPQAIEDTVALESIILRRSRPVLTIRGNEAKLLMQRIVRSVDQWTWQGQVGRFKSSNTPLPPVETQ